MGMPGICRSSLLRHGSRFRLGEGSDSDSQRVCAPQFRLHAIASDTIPPGPSNRKVGRAERAGRALHSCNHPSGICTVAAYVTGGEWPMSRPDAFHSGAIGAVTSRVTTQSAFLKARSFRAAGLGSCTAIICTRVPYSRRCRGRSVRRSSPSAPVATRCGIRLRPTCYGGI